MQIHNKAREGNGATTDRRNIRYRNREIRETKYQPYGMKKKNRQIHIEQKGKQVSATQRESINYLVKVT